MPELATDSIIEKKPPLKEPQKGEECIFCNGTLYWEDPEGRECVKCKHFYPKTPLEV